MMDWGDLAAQSLPTLNDDSSGGFFSNHQRPTLTPSNTGSSWNRPSPSLHEFHTNTSTAANSAALHHDSVFSLRSTTLFESDSTRHANNYQQQQPSFDELVAQHEHEVLESILQAAVESTRRQTEELFERQLQAKLQRERLQWTSSSNNNHDTSTTETSLVVPGAAKTLPLSVSDNSNRLPLTASSSSSRSYKLAAAIVVDAPDRLVAALMRAHLEIVTKYSSSRPLAMVQQLIALPNNILPVGDVSAGYTVMWQLIEELLQLPASNPPSTYTYDPVEQARAYLIFLCKQTKHYIVDRVRRANLAGQDVAPYTNTTNNNNNNNNSGGGGVVTYRTHMATMCASFVKLTLGTHSSSQQQQSNYWAVAYYCLRCGDAVATKEVLELAGKNQLDHHQSDADAAVLRLVNAMALVQGNRACFWQGHSAPTLAAQDRQAVSILLERIKNQEHANEEQTIHQIGLYTLCCAIDTLPVSEKVFGFMAVEDYLSGALWKALLSFQPIDELVDFGETITNYGPEYFGQNLVPLFVSQQYETVLTHLTDTCGRVGCVYAAHLALVLSSVGVSLGNLNKSLQNGTSGSGSHGTTNLAASLITAYTELLLADTSFGPAAALEYITRIPNKLRASHEAAALIAKTGQTDVLVGSLSKEGVRTGPALLDKHFTKEEVASILTNAASILLRDKGNHSKMSVAVLCFSLAERFADALALMSELLSPPDQEVDAYRAFWLKEVDVFHNNFLKQRTHVTEVLERENKLSYVTTNQAIIDLNRFFQLRRNGELDKAWPILQHLKILPTNQQDLTSKTNEYQQLDWLLKQALPSVIVTTVEMLHAEYKRINLLSSQQQQQWTLQERLRELKEQIQTIATYTSITGVVMSQEQLDNLNRTASVV